MREIKFRGKRLDNGEWVYGYLIGNDVIVGDIVESSNEYFNTEFWYKVDPKTVGQFTGIKDENGTGIYEGDILRDEFDRVFRVYWVDGEARFTIRQKKRKTEYFMVISHIHPVVIGNIYENPELLKGDEFK